MIGFKRLFYFFLTAMCLVVLFSQCAKRETRDKIKLDSAVIRKTNESPGLATTLRVLPEDRRSVAIFYFENVTGDTELDWMRRGLAQMLVTDLSQSRYVDVISEQGLGDTMERMGIEGDRRLDASLAVSIAKEARLETALVGSFVKIGKTIRIDCHLYDTKTGKLLKADRVEGKGLEQVFTLVDELTRQVRDGLKLTFKGVVEFDKGLTEVTTNSIEAYRYFAQGLELNEKLFYREAAEHLERAVAIDTTFATAYLNLARTYINLARSEDARRVLARAVAFSDHVTELERLNIMALDASLKGNYLEHIDILEQMVARFPNDKETHYNLARMYDKLQRFDEAIEQYESALAIDPAYKLVYNQLGYTYSARGMHDKAVESLKQYIEMAPNEPNPHDSMGEIYQRAGLLDEAIDEFREASRLGPDLHFPWVHLGFAYQDKGEFDEAIRCFQHYIDMAPSDALKSSGFQLVGETYWAKEDHKRALDAYTTAIEVYKNDFSSVDYISELYMDQGDTAKSTAFREEWFQSTGDRILKSNSFKDILSFTGMCLYLDINIGELEPFIRKCWDLAENDLNRGSCTAIRAMVNLKQGDADSALAGWATVIALPSIQNRIGIDFYDAKIISQAMAENADDPGKVMDFYQTIIDKIQEMENPSLESTVNYLLFEYYKRIGDDTSIENGLIASGTPRESDWWIIGPFENEDGFQRRFPPERETDLSKTYNGKGGKVQWRQAQDSTFEGYIDLKELLEPDTWTVAYGLLSFDCPSARRAQLRVGTDDAVRVWLNGTEVWKRNIRRSAVTDTDIIQVELEEGTNSVLIKVCQTISQWGFFFRITDPQGKAIQDITYLPQEVI